jgi:hypothetical protein
MPYPVLLFNGRIFHKIRRRIKKEGGGGERGEWEGREITCS